MRATMLRLTSSLALTLLAGCSLVYSDDLSKKQCSDQSECDPYAAQLGTPLVCRSNACQAPICSMQNDCPQGSTCVQNECIASRDGGTPQPRACVQDSDCPAENRCGWDKVCYEKWGCLEQTAQWTAVKVSPTLEFAVRNIASLDDPSKLPELSAEACGPNDLACGAPFVDRQSASVSSDKVVTVPFKNVAAKGFTGFVRVMAKSGMDGGVAIAGDGGASQLLPNYIHFTTDTPLVDDYPVQHRLLMIESENFNAFSLVTGVELDQAKGSVGIQVYDCGGRAAPDVTMTANGYGGAYFTPVQGESLPIIGKDVTDGNGAGIMINLRADTLQLFTLRDVAQNRVITDSLNFVVKGAAINYVMYYPRQSALKKWTDQAQKTAQ